MGRPELDPEISIFVERMSADWARHPPFMSLPADEARRIAEEVRAPWRADGPAMARTAEQIVPTSTGPLRTRLYDPGLSAPAPTLIYLHGGGFILFSIDTHDRLMREYAAAGRFAVLGVDYPLSPEARYPRALNQIVELIDWLHDGGAEGLGVDPHRLAIGGDFAAAICRWPPRSACATAARPIGSKGCCSITAPSPQNARTKRKRASADPRRCSSAPR